MPGSKITELRKSGKLKEAYKLAKENLDAKPDDIWAKRDVSWVLYEFLKQTVEKKNVGNALKILKEIEKRQLPNTEKMLFDSLAWQTGKLLYHQTAIIPARLDDFAESIKTFSFTKPSDAYTFLAKAFSKQSAGWSGFYDFIRWWGPGNFQQKDFNQKKLDNGKRIISNAEQIYSSIAKNVLQQPVDLTEVEWLLPRMDRLTTEHPEMQYPPFYLAKLLLATGDKQRFLKAFIPFARKKKRDFWVWDLMSEAFNKTDDEYFACLCRSLLCGAPDKFTINVRTKIGNVFMKKNMLAEAKFEYQNVLHTRQKENWPLKEKHLKWQRLPWWEDTKAAHVNLKFYHDHTALADTLLFADKPEELMVVEKVNPEKSILNFVISKEKSGFFHYNPKKISPKPGDLFLVRFVGKKETKSNFYKLLTLRSTRENPPESVFRKAKGKLNIKQGHSFGFIDDLFVPPGLVAGHRLKNRDEVVVTAIISFNRKKKEWGWKVVKLV